VFLVSLSAHQTSAERMTSSTLITAFA